MLGLGSCFNIVVCGDTIAVRLREKVSLSFCKNLVRSFKKITFEESLTGFFQNDRTDFR